ncbi:MAG: hypothetical protein M1609_09375 [Firmicutes bacterium]|nr:hypothetical protein [Bacillota bacterium]
MLPIQIKRMQNQLLHWGYQDYAVKHMKPWDLLGTFQFEQRRPHHVYLPAGKLEQHSAPPAQQLTTPKHIDTMV